MFILNGTDIKHFLLGLDMNITHAALVYADDVNKVGDDIMAIERNAEVLVRILVQQ